MTASGRRAALTRTAKWGGVALAATAAIVLAAYLLAAGLDGADKLASVLSALAGLAGVALALVGIMSGRRGDGTGRPEVSMVVDSGSVGQTVQAQRIDSITFGASGTPRVDESDTPRPD